MEIAVDDGLQPVAVHGQPFVVVGEAGVEFQRVEFQPSRPHLPMGVVEREGAGEAFDAVALQVGGDVGGEDNGAVGLDEVEVGEVGVGNLDIGIVAFLCQMGGGREVEVDE